MKNKSSCTFETKANVRFNVNVAHNKSKYRTFVCRKICFYLFKSPLLSFSLYTYFPVPYIALSDVTNIESNENHIEYCPFGVNSSKNSYYILYRNGTYTNEFSS